MISVSWHGTSADFRPLSGILVSNGTLAKLLHQNGVEDFRPLSGILVSNLCDKSYQKKFDRISVPFRGFWFLIHMTVHCKEVLTFPSPFGDFGF